MVRAFLSLLLFSSLAAAEEKTVFYTDFDSADSSKNTGQSGQIVKGYQGTPSLLLERSGVGSKVRSFSLPAKKITGQAVTLRAQVKAEAVSQPPQSWNGIKVMLVLELGDGKQYPQLALPAGTFGWRSAKKILRIPKGITKATLVVGLEQVSGKAWFDNLQVSVGWPARKGKRLPVKFKGHDLPRLRGVMHGPQFREEDIRELAQNWNANQVRWQLNWTPMKQAEEWARDLEAYDRWLDGALAQCDKALDVCEKYNLMVLVDLHTPPGGRAQGGVCRMFQEKKYQDKLIEVWDKIARRYQGRKCVYAYDLLNEAVEGTVAVGLLNWRDLATQATKTIRKIDPGKPVVFEPSPWGGAQGFDMLEPLDIERVIYSFHMYQPFKFTHQTLYNNPAGVHYPGIIDGVMWDKERLREAMAPAIDFQREFNVQIYVGEFSAIRWAPGESAYLYLRDLIDLFEEYGWDWSYHAYREWDGWSVEHGPDRQNRKPTPQPTKRKQLLLKWCAQNQKPAQ
jgi:endoglucanase